MSKKQIKKVVCICIGFVFSCFLLYTLLISIINQKKTTFAVESSKDIYLDVKKCEWGSQYQGTTFGHISFTVYGKLGNSCYFSYVQEIEMGYGPRIFCNIPDTTDIDTTHRYEIKNSLLNRSFIDLDITKIDKFCNVSR